MTEQTTVLLENDEPINSFEEDKLFREDFCTSLAKSIKKWDGKRSLTIGLCGPWGSGKSSIKNLALSTLQGNSDLEILEFNAYQLSGAKTIEKFFFECIQERFNSFKNKKDKKFYSSLSKQLAHYADILEFGSTTSKDLLQNPSLIQLLLLVSSVFGLTISNAIASKIIFCLLFLSSIADSLKKILFSLSKIFSTRAELIEESLDETKDMIQNSLRQSSKTFLIVFDDIDRLSPSEIRDLMKLVRVNANFPKFIYLLLFQRDIVEKSLDTLLPKAQHFGKEFLEKIIQFSLDIPQASREDLEKILFPALDNMIEIYSIKDAFNKERWSLLYHEGLKYFFENIRDIKRYLNSLRFKSALFIKNNFFEVDFIDLMSIEIIRLFEPAVYKDIWKMKYFTDISLSLKNEKTIKEEKKNFWEDLMNSASKEKQIYVQNILLDLFPAFREIIDDGAFRYSGNDEELLKDLRICHPDIFDRYFRLSLKKEEISQFELNQILNNLKNKNEIHILLNSLKEQKLLRNMIEKLWVNRKEIKENDIINFSVALFDSGDTVEREQVSFLRERLSTLIVRFVYVLILKNTSDEKRAEIFHEIIKQTNSICLSAILVLWEKHGIEDKSEAVFTNSQEIEKDQKICSERIDKFLKTENFYKHPQLRNILDALLEFNEKDTIKEWIKKFINDHFFLFLELMLVDSDPPQFKIDAKRVEKFISFDCVVEILNKLNLDKNSLNQREKELLKILQDAINKKTAS